jgi:hypothetical protein
MPTETITPPEKRSADRRMAVALLLLWREQYQEALRLSRWRIPVRLSHWDERAADVLLPHTTRHASSGFADMAGKVAAGALAFDALLRNVRGYTLRLASALNETTARRANAARPDDLYAAIADPKRARLVASNESFRLNVYGETSAVRADPRPWNKTWHAQPGCCKVCAGLDGMTVPVGDPFSVRIFHPPDPHPSCRCRLSYELGRTPPP